MKQVEMSKYGMACPWCGGRENVVTSPFSCESREECPQCNGPGYFPRAANLEDMNNDNAGKGL